MLTQWYSANSRFGECLEKYAALLLLQKPEGEIQTNMFIYRTKSKKTGLASQYYNIAF